MALEAIVIWTSEALKSSNLKQSYVVGSTGFEENQHLSSPWDLLFKRQISAYLNGAFLGVVELLSFLLTRDPALQEISIQLGRKDYEEENNR